MGTLSGVDLPHESAIVPGAAAVTDMKAPGLDSNCSIITARHITADLVTNVDVGAEVSIIGADTFQLSTTDTTGNFVFIAWLKGE